MTLSCILLAAPKRLHLWHEVGASMIAIDTLVHNFLVRTGILARFEADHSYGAACYQAGGCADIIEPWPSGSMPGSSIPGFRSHFRGSSSTRSGGTAPSLASTSATAIASMIGSLAITSTAKFARCVIA